MASRSRALPRLLRHSGLGRSLAGFIVVGFALVLGHTAGPSVFPRTQSPVAPAATPVPAVAPAGDPTAAFTRPALPAEPGSRAKPEAVTQGNSPAPVTVEARPPATHPPCCSLPSSKVAAPQAGTPASPTGSTAASAEPAGVGLDFTARLLDGTEFRLDEHRGRVVPIYAMAGWCLSCIPEAQAWARLYPEYHQRGLDVLRLSVDPSDTPATLASFSNLAGREVAALPWAIDRDQTLPRLLDVRTLDQTIIIDRRGRVACVDYGPTSSDQLRRVVDQLLQGEP